MSWPILDRRKALLIAKRDLRDAISELRLLAAVIALTLAVPIGSAAGVRGLAYFGGGTAVVNRLSLVGAFFVVFVPRASRSSWPSKHLLARESARPLKFCSPHLFEKQRSSRARSSLCWRCR